MGGRGGESRAAGVRDDAQAESLDLSQIFVEGLEFTGKHGVYEEERREGRGFRVDLRVDVDTRPAAMTHALEDAVDYRGLAEVILEIGTGPSTILVETLSHRMIDEIFARFPQVSKVFLSLKKFATGVPGNPVCVGVYLRRSREGDDVL